MNIGAVTIFACIFSAIMGFISQNIRAGGKTFFIGYIIGNAAGMVTAAAVLMK